MAEPPKRADPRTEPDDDPTALHRHARPGAGDRREPSKDFVLASMLPPRQLDDLGGSDDFEKTQVGQTVVGAKAYQPPAEVRSKHAYLTVMAGARAGEMFRLDRDETVLGRGPQSTIHLDSDGVSRRHARIVRQGGDVFVLEDLGSTNGTFVLGGDGQEEPRVTFRRLAPGDRIQVGTEVILRFSVLDDMEAQLQQQLYESAVRDPLTKAYNRKHFQERLRSEIAHALRHTAHLSLVVLDIDHFKRINDTWGHPAGDAVLRALSAAIMKAIRIEDVFARIGGEEFTLLARGIDIHHALAFAERLRKGIERLSVPWNTETGEIRITSSLGVAALAEIAVDPSGPKSVDGDQLFARADQRLYAAKNGGRNQVVGPAGPVQR